MSDLLAILNQAGASLAAHRGSAATASHNLQNADTPGYARQRAELAAVQPAGLVGGAWIGRGVELTGVYQVRDRFLEAQLPAAQGAAARATVTADTLEAVHALDPDLPGGLTDALGSFYASLRSLTQQPASLGVRQATVSAAQALTRSFNTTASALEAARGGLDARLSGQLSEVNDLAARLAELNGRIRTSAAQGSAPNDLLDARQRLQDRLVTLTGAQPFATSDGDVGLALRSGQALVSGASAARLALAANPANGGHLDVQLVPVGATAGLTLGPGALGGELGGALEARDGALRAAGEQLDALAHELSGALNTAHAAGYALDGSTGRPLFSVTAGPAGAARALALDAQVAGDPRLLAAASATPVASGDGRAAQALLDTEAATLASGFTPAGALGALVTAFGGAARHARATADHEAGLHGHLEALRDAASGVSIDEELIALTRAQRAFEAVSKVISTTDQMLQTLLELR